MPERDRSGVPYEITLELYRDGGRFGVVGQRCGYLLAALAGRLAAARRDGSPQAARWPDPDDRFPDPPAGSPESCTRCRRRRLQPSPDPELFDLRYRDRVDVVSTGELRCTVRTSSVWLPGAEAGGDSWSPARSRRRGRWRLARRAIVEAWGAGGHGVRAVLTSRQLAEFLAALLAEAERQIGPISGEMLQAGRGTGDSGHN
ncbi:MULTISPECIES: hypothetical protein [Thermomonospora]|uniref:Uncharacterized protein n=1 Tax=Thermomonospora curvata (strain ATCC 19995 / DSM 43183 / JCM 3096 / KCTC 9072 / NBRC 15933 / NCIMB 10081 / Henssen B9) TaxID=471852 RepID=D1A8G5_THECD|nr:MULTISPECIES: hypothetical protein [Thermomonospora]ACY96660.1 hypothetical protein Tcur_1074 [Thermomonospora curvata DSM 43183]PKK15528.1 MAG: hypothetical protein BUE48_005225 [Thermomonospora sp. CIF 1]